MREKNMFVMVLWIAVMAVVVTTFSINHTSAQEARSLVPYPRGIQVETVDPASRMPHNSFCIGPNAIDVKLTNTSSYRRYISVMNRDTRGIERTLYHGWLDPGIHYLSVLTRQSFAISGPAGSEMLRVDTNDNGGMTPGNNVTFYVQECGGSYPPDNGCGAMASLQAQIYPYAIPQGGKGTLTLQTNVGCQSNATYYFEILNSWGQLWKRIPVSKRPYDYYQVTLPVGTKTKPGMLTYMVNLWMESGFAGARRKVATTLFTFQVVIPGSGQTSYNPGYLTSSGWYMPYNSMSYPGTSYDLGLPYGDATYGGTYPYGAPMAPQGERALE